MSPVSPPAAPAPGPPRWARVIDLLCLAILVLALVVAAYGGFRARFGGIRLAITSPYRLLIVAAVLALVRHLMAPAFPVYRDMPARLRRAWHSPAARSALIACVGTRPAILFVGYMAVVMIGFNHDRAPERVSANEVANLQMRWDTAWYFGIAVEGYNYFSNNPNQQQNIVFFPAYPMLMRVGGRLLGNVATSYLLAGTLISFAAFFWALTYLFRLARDLVGDEGLARYAVWLIAVYPFAWFFSAAYTESLFLLGATATFYHFRRHELVKAGLFGLLVGLTRPNGCFVSIPLTLLAVSPWLPAWLVGGRRDEAPPFTLSRIAGPIAAAAMPGIGVLLYSAYIWNLTGDPLAWAAGHAAWGRQYRGLSVLVADRYEWLVKDGVYVYSSVLPADLLNLLGALFVIAAAWPVARRLGLAYAAFILINILPPLAAGGMLSAGRFSSVLFPAFIWFATVVPERHRPAWLAAFMTIQAFGATLFYTWHELY